MLYFQTKIGTMRKVKRKNTDDVNVVQVNKKYRAHDHTTGYNLYTAEKGRGKASL